MAWRNAFELMATESTLLRILHNLSFPKDPSGRQRIIVDNQPTVSVLTANSGDSATRRPWHDINAQFMVDEREHMRNAMRANYQRSVDRWTY